MHEGGRASQSTVPSRRKRTRKINDGTLSKASSHPCHPLSPSLPLSLSLSLSTLMVVYSYVEGGRQHLHRHVSRRFHKGVRARTFPTFSVILISRVETTAEFPFPMLAYQSERLRESFPTAVIKQPGEQMEVLSRTVPFSPACSLVVQAISESVTIVFCDLLDFVIVLPTSKALS